MLTQTPPTRSLAHLSLTLVGLMWVLPFLYPTHTYPLTTFYQEWLAVTLGLMAALWLLAPDQWRTSDVPNILLLPLGLALIVLIQLLQGKLVYAGHGLLLTEYFLWAGILMLLGFRLGKQLGMPYVLVTLAGFLLLGAELNALLGLHQHYHWHTPFSGVVTGKVAVAVYGNLAQPNHYANQLALGLISLGLLGALRKIPGWLVATLALPLLFVMVLSGSRTSWLYFLVLPLLALPHRRATSEFRWLWYYSLLLPTGFALMHGIVKLPWFATQDGISSFSRLYQESGGNSIRLYLWREALHIWSDFPLLGAGFGQFAWQHFIRLPEFANPAIAGLYNNAHNLILHLAAETGLVGLLLVLGTLVSWGRRVRTQPASPWLWWAYGVCTVLGLHSLLEYPLWYTYFLGVAAIVLGAVEPAGYRLARPNWGRLSVAAVLLFGVIVSITLAANYRELEGLTKLNTSRLNDPAAIKRQVTALNALTGQPELRSYAEFYLNPMYRPEPGYLAYTHALNQRVLHSFPIGQVAYREVLFLALEGRTEEAQTMLLYAIWSYPQEFAATRDILVDLARKDPARYSALLKFGLQKFEERQRAVSAR